MPREGAQPRCRIPRRVKPVRRRAGHRDDLAARATETRGNSAQPTPSPRHIWAPAAVIPRPLLPALARLREDPQGASLPRGQRQGWGRKPTVGDCPGSRRLGSGGGNYPAGVLPGGGRAPAPGSLGDPALLSDPPCLMGRLSPPPKAEEACEEVPSVRPRSRPLIWGAACQSRSPWPPGRRGQAWGGGSGCHGAPPSLEERPPDRLQAQCGVAGWPPATQLYCLTFCKTTGSQPIFSPRHRTQSKKPTAHVKAERGNLSSGPSPESLARAPRRRGIPAPAARTEPGGRHSPVQRGACRWDGGASGEGRAGNSLGSKGKEGLEIPRSFLLSSFCLLRGFVP